MKDRKKLIEVFPNWTNDGGIFSALQSFDVPWKNENIHDALDLEYFGDVSGDKFISPLIDKLMEGETLTSTEIGLLATAIMAVNGVNWGKLWETQSFDYDPIQNYKMTEIMTDDETVIEYGKQSTRTDNLSHSKTGTETNNFDGDSTRTDNLTTETEPDVTTTENDNVYGFNSVESVPTDERTQTATGTTTETHTGTQNIIQDNSDTTTYNTTESDTGTQGVVDSGSDTHTRNYTLTREGNIGVTTSQQMIESERNLWIWNFFRNIVFPDIDKILTLRIY